MSITADTSHTLKGEVKGHSRKPCFLKKRNEERAEAAVNMEWEIAFSFESEPRKSSNVVDNAMGKVRC